ncbi:GntR family transcriptional regulator [Paracoccus laeviglucosivorans]|uniref:DNA-binding transcriptional regulator, GntR family n=1 Tax=Paracoccus laeviglucosivorans TaxID=1197861 RepID=A0A521B7Z7_9RHOB|nr:GntR family transcriptional regulator [Paracoccus laeviglucosivorans]SMO43203.1 DNA-binding transcriptional regulator, GntR family [Paracoccus laeviglucosivorans]
MIEEGTLNRRALAALAHALRQGELRAGQFLSMPQLVDLLKLPLAPVRDAARHAAASGWLEIIPKRGVQVMEATPDIIRDSLDLRMVLDQEGARRRIAGGLEGLAALRQTHQAMLDEALGVGVPGLSLRAMGVDGSLHQYLADGLGNALLRETYAANRIRIDIIQRVRPFVQERVRSAMEEHLAIIAALEARDADAAVAALSLHCARTRHWWGLPD